MEAIAKHGAVERQEHDAHQYDTPLNVVPTSNASTSLRFSPLYGVSSIVNPSDSLNVSNWTPALELAKTVSESIGDTEKLLEVST